MLNISLAQQTQVHFETNKYSSLPPVSQRLYVRLYAAKDNRFRWVRIGRIPEKQVLLHKPPQRSAWIAAGG